MALEGISVKKPAGKPYLVTGHKLYMIGTQDGLFSERGEHIPYEMWGIWAPPVKVLNGFWIQVDQELVQEAEVFEMLPYGCKFLFSKEKEWELSRFQFVPQEENGFVLELKLKNLSQEEKEFPVELGIQSNLMPVWLAERAGIVDGKDEAMFDQQEQKLMLKDSQNQWTAMMVSSQPMTHIKDAKPPVSRRENENTIYCSLESTISLKPEEEKTITYCFSFSPESEQEADKTVEKIACNKDKLLQEKWDIYQQIEKTARLTYPQKPVFEEMYRWTKFVNDWIIRDVEGIGKGVVAGYAEFPWWFGNDTNYIAPALLMQGEYEVCKSTLRLVKEKSEKVNGNGRVVHEISSNGVVYYDGMTTETPQFADTVWMVYQWSGDREFLMEMYAFCVKGIEWMDSICVDGLPAGYGISEIAGLNCFCCDTALLAVRGYEILGLMSEALGKTEAAREYYRKKESTWKVFQKEFYMPEYKLYGDMVATKEEIIPRADAWRYTLNSFPITEEEKIMGESSCKADKSPESAEEKAKLRKRMEGVIEEARQMEDGSRKAFYLFGAVHSSVPIEFGYLEGKAAEEIFDAQREIAKKEHITIEHMMPIGIGREVTGLGNVQRLKDLIAEIQLVADGFSAVMPGATNEIYPEQGCFVQAWNSLATMWPYANSIFGIKPDACQKTVELKPCVGAEVEGMSLEDLVIGNALFSFWYTIENGENIITVKRPSKDWKIELDKNTKNVTLKIED